jgi:hypothetical protein
MTKTIHSTLIALMILLLVMGGCTSSDSGTDSGSDTMNEPIWQTDFGLTERTLVPTGRNPYFILEPGYQLTLENENEKLVITVLDETREINGVVTRMVEEREWEDDELVEVSKNFFAICEHTQDVFYFGEEVDDYKNGQIVSHDGAWLAGQNGAQAGLIIPGKPKVGLRYYQEMAPDVAMDRAEVISLEVAYRTPARMFSRCLKIQEGTLLHPQEKEFKHYAPGIGLIQDEDLLLTEYGFASP